MCLDCGCLQPANDHGDPAHITLADLNAAAKASGISADEAAANIVTTVRDVELNALPVAKSASEQRYVLGVAYQPGKDVRIAKGVDGGRDFFTEAELEKAAWQFLQEQPEVGIYHIDGTLGAARIVESYIYRGPDWDLGEGVVVKSGWWLVGAILDERSWDMHKAGKINGWSPQGIAKRRRTVKKAAAPVSAGITVAGPEDQLAAFLTLCNTIQWLCSAGASRTVQIDVDGDGSGALRFDFGDLAMPAVDESQMGADVIRVPGIGD